MVFLWFSYGSSHLFPPQNVEPLGQRQPAGAEILRGRRQELAVALAAAERPGDAAEPGLGPDPEHG